MNTFPRLLKSLRSHSHSRAHGPLLPSSKQATLHLSGPTSVVTFLPRTLAFCPLLHFQGPCDDSESIGIPQGNLAILRSAH